MVKDILIIVILFFNLINLETIEIKSIYSDNSPKLDGIIKDDWNDSIKMNITFNYNTTYHYDAILLTKYNNEALYIGIAIQDRDSIPQQQMVITFDYDDNGIFNQGDYGIYVGMLSNNNCTYNFMKYKGNYNIEYVSNSTVSHIAVLYDGNLVSYEYKIPFKEFNIEKKKMGLNILFRDAIKYPNQSYAFYNASKVSPEKMHFVKFVYTDNSTNSNNNIPGYYHENILIGIFISFILFKKFKKINIKSDTKNF